MPPTHAFAQSSDQTHANIVLPKSQAIAAAHLSILFAVIEFYLFIYLFIFMYFHIGLVAVVVMVDFGYVSGGG